MSVGREYHIILFYFSLCHYIRSTTHAERGANSISNPCKVTPCDKFHERTAASSCTWALVPRASVVDTTALSPFTFALSLFSSCPFQKIFSGATRKGALEWIFVLQGLISALQKLYNYRVTVASKPTNTDTIQTQTNNSDLWGKEGGFKERKAEEQLIRQKPAEESELSQRIWIKFMPVISV